jgi:hypothetical protein
MPATPDILNPARTSRRNDLLAILLLLLLCIPWFYTLTLPFCIVDDPYFIVANRYMQNGLSLEDVSWACSTGYGDYWHPLLWLSLMLDETLFGMKAWGFHLINTLFHIANTLLLFLFVKKVWGGTWKSFLCAALFALHPQRVESVAWATERKDVLAAFFGLLSLLAYLQYVQRRGAARYLLVCAAFFLSLLAKPMLVTMPLLLLLLDIFALGMLKNERLLRLLAEKVVLVLLAFDEAVNVYLHGLVHGSFRGDLGSCIQNTVLNYWHYVCQLFIPWPLILFPHAQLWIPWWRVGLAELGLLLISALVFIAWRKRWRGAYPLVFGWLWYIVCMLPMSGLLQPGYSMRGDRFTYMPCLGLLVAIIWGILPAVAPLRRRLPILFASAAILVAYTAITVDRIHLWQDNLALCEHDLALDPDNAWLHAWSGWVAGERGLVSLQRYHTVQAASLDPDSFFSRGTPIPQLPPNMPIITAAPRNSLWTNAPDFKVPNTTSSTAAHSGSK